MVYLTNSKGLPDYLQFNGNQLGTTPQYLLDMEYQIAIEKLGLTCYSAQDEIDSVNRIMNADPCTCFFFGHITDRWWAHDNKYDDRLGV